jgi:hypothetical protein
MLVQRYTQLLRVASTRPRLVRLIAALGSELPCFLKKTCPLTAFHEAASPRVLNPFHVNLRTKATRRETTLLSREEAQNAAQYALCVKFPDGE